MITKDHNNAILAGVCSGIARDLGVDPLWVRLLFLLLVPTFGSGLLIYVLLAIIIPDEG